MKGISSFIEYTIVILLGLVIVIGVSILAYSFYNNAVTIVVKGELKQVAVQTAESVLKIYGVGKTSQITPSINSSVQLATLNIPLPRQLANKNYKITLLQTGNLWTSISNVTNQTTTFPFIGLTNSRVLTETTQDPLLSVTQDIPNLDVYIQGTSFLANSTLTYYRYNINGNITDVILLGTGTVFSQITGES